MILPDVGHGELAYLTKRYTCKRTCSITLLDYETFQASFAPKDAYAGLGNVMKLQRSSDFH